MRQAGVTERKRPTSNVVTDHVGDGGGVGSVGKGAMDASGTSFTSASSEILRRNPEHCRLTLGGRKQFSSYPVVGKLFCHDLRLTPSEVEHGDGDKDDCHARKHAADNAACEDRSDQPSSCLGRTSRVSRLTDVAR